MLDTAFKTETVEDMADLLGSLLMVGSTAYLVKKFVETRNELDEGYNDLVIAFDTIATLLEPALTHITNEMMSKPKPHKQRVKHGT
jgi:hypothetical protein